MEGLLVPEEVEQTIATAEVRQTFKASRVGTIAGCFVASGTVRRGAQVRLVRDGTIIHDGRIGSLRRFQNDYPAWQITTSLDQIFEEFLVDFTAGAAVAA